MIPTTTTQRKTSKRSTQQHPPAQIKQKLPMKSNRPLVQQIYPIQIHHPQLMSTQLKQYIAQLQREYIERYNVLLNNRIKYDQMIQNLAIVLDQKGISNHVVSDLLKNSSYHHQME